MRLGEIKKDIRRYMDRNLLRIAYDDWANEKGILCIVEYCVFVVFLSILWLRNKTIPWIGLFLLSECARKILTFGTVNLNLSAECPLASLVWVPHLGAIILCAASFLLCQGGALCFPAEEINVWFILLLFSLYAILTKIIAIIQRERRKVILVVLFGIDTVGFVLASVIRGIGGAILFALALVFFVYLLWAFAYASIHFKKGGLFVITPLLPHVSYISQSYESYLRNRSEPRAINEENFRSLSCADRKAIIKEELEEMCKVLRPGQIYLVETHVVVIRIMHSRILRNGQKLSRSYFLPTFGKLSDSAFRKLYQDKYKECPSCEYCHTGNGCSVTRDDLLDKNVYSRDPRFWVFSVQKKL